MRLLRFGTAVLASGLATGTAQAADSFIFATEPTVEEASAVSGFIEGRYGSLGSSVGEEEANAAAPDDDIVVDGGKWTLRGTVNARAGDFNVQVEAEFSAVDAGPYESSIGNGTIHAYYRPTGGSYAVGAFLRGGREDFLQLSEIATERMDGVTDDLLIGSEVAFLSEHATLHLRTGIGTRRDSPRGSDVGLDSDRLHIGAGANFYVGENLRFDLDGTYDRFENEQFQTDVDRFAIDGRANYRFASAPVSVFAGYRYETREIRSRLATEESESNLNTLYAGARLHFGTQTLKQEDRSGALWDTMDVMPR